MSSVSNVKKKGKDTLPVVVAAVKTVKDATSGVVVLAPATAIAVAIVQKLAKAVDNADRCNLMIECIVNLLNAVAKGCEGASGKPEVTDRVKTLEHDLEEICKSVEAVMKAQNRWRYVVPEKYGSQLDALDSKMKHCLDKYQITAIAYNVEHQNRELRLVSEAMERLNGKLGQSSISGVDPNGLTADEELTTGTCECPPTILAVTRWLQKQAPWSSIGDIAPNIAQDVINMLHTLTSTPLTKLNIEGSL
ncbi:hypothetical protein CPB85DRAFT_960401 [Mucidula mucida]|nr:hypothetical protein CPB85DRAFT_960401 [Mucidula mucida]